MTRGVQCGSCGAEVDWTDEICRACGCELEVSEFDEAMNVLESAQLSLLLADEYDLEDA